MAKKLISWTLILCITLLCLIPLLSFSACKKKSRKEFIESALNNQKNNTENEIKILKFGMATSPVTLDPSLASDSGSLLIIQNIFDTLVKFSENADKFEPCLAESWEISPDGTEYTFHLRQDAKFSDGSILTAESVKYSFERQMGTNKTENMVYADFAFGMIDNIEIIGTYTLKIKLKYPYSPFLSVMAMGVATSIVSPEALQKLGSDFGVNPVGSGPYKLVSWDKQTSLVLEKNENYWGTKPSIDRIEIYTFADGKENDKLINMLNTGEIDVISHVRSDDITKVEQNGNCVIKRKQLNINYLALNTSRPIFSNVSLREAVANAINVDEVIRVVFNGISEKAITFLPSNIAGFTNDVKTYNYDPEKAKAIVWQSGYYGAEVKILVPQNENKIKFANVISDYINKVGLKATLVVFEPKQYPEILNSEYDIFISGWNADIPDPDNFLQLFESTNKLNDTKLNDPSIDTMLRYARVKPDSSERNEIYKNILRKLSRDVVFIPICHSVRTVAFRPYVKNVRVNSVNGCIYFADLQKEK